MIDRTFKRGKRWYVDYRDPVTGKRVRKSVGTREAHATNVLAKIQTDIVEKRYFEPKKEAPRVPLEQFGQEYVAWAKTNRASWEAIEDHVRRATLFFKDKALDEVTPLEIEHYKTWLTEKISERTGKRLSPRSVLYSLAVLKGMYTKAVKWGKAQSNPVKQVDMPRVNNMRDRFLDGREIQALLKVCEEGPSYLRPLAVVALGTGMRLGELLSLRFADVDYGKGLIRVREAKSGEGRTLPMNDEVREAIRSCMAIEGILKPNDGHVFTYRGKRLGNVHASYGKALAAAGLKAGDVTFHTLRHTFASHLASSGSVDLLVLKELLGHKTLAMTVRYAHLFPDRGKRAVDLLPSLYAASPVALSQS